MRCGVGTFESVRVRGPWTIVLAMTALLIGLAFVLLLLPLVVTALIVLAAARAGRGVAARLRGDGAGRQNVRVVIRR